MMGADVVSLCERRRNRMSVRLLAWTLQGLELSQIMNLIHHRRLRKQDNEVPPMIERRDTRVRIELPTEVAMKVKKAAKRAMVSAVSGVADHLRRENGGDHDEWIDEAAIQVADALVALACPSGEGVPR